MLVDAVLGVVHHTANESHTRVTREETKQQTTQIYDSWHELGCPRIRRWHWLVGWAEPRALQQHHVVNYLRYGTMRREDIG